MYKKIVVFDFDGTLIKDDSFSIIVNNIVKSNMYKKLFFKFINTLYIKGFIDNTKFKKLCVRFLFAGIEIEEFKQLLLKMASFLIEQNKVNFNIIDELIFYAKSRDNFVIIISATPLYIVENILCEIIKRYKAEFLENFKKDVKIIGSSFIYNNNKRYILLENIYSQKKKEVLHTIGIDKIDIFYTDSEREDKPLIDISKDIFLIKDGQKLSGYWRNHD